ncbi:NAD(P)/FAD-dependent oxidoreductase [Parvularcula marina]|uniref:NAD(P)/FAD-dependent oxidoreductase n=1 Tax=Parvularcula marina TaxID=2292771 RepID=UPI003516273D
MSDFDILIVGGGHAGAQAAITLRQGKFTGSIGLISAESFAPYERPPLSKDYLAGEKDFDRILIRPETFWAEQDITLLLDHEVTAVDPGAHRVTTADGKSYGYGQLIWATGGTPRRLEVPGHNPQNMHVIRSRSDVDPLMASLPQTNRVAVIGGGYIGLEAAAVMRKFGKEVAVIEAMERVMARVAGEPLSRFYEAEHTAQGVDMRLNAKLSSFKITGQKVTGVTLESGETLPCDMVIVGIGIDPVVAPLLEVGATGGNGVRVDAQCRTSLPDVFAIGDCALHQNKFAEGAWVRLESVQNANDQARVVAKTILGKPASYEAIPWFWSDQYDLHLQTIGLSLGHDDMVVRGHPEDRSFSVVYLKKGRVIALDCVNRPADYAQGRLLIMQGASPAHDQLRNINVGLKEMAG